jgi:flavin-dependent dehydrogenase
MAAGDRETLDVDVLFVGGGPAGLAGAIRLRQLLRAHNEKIKQDGGGAPLELSIALLEKGRSSIRRGCASSIPTSRSAAARWRARSPTTESGS